ncbi:MAG: helix-turn-helix domain-containing protein [Bacteroidia bacterium]
MLSIPFRLLELPSVKLWQQDAHGFLLQKRVEEPVQERKSYLGMHAISLVLQGRQTIKDEAGGYLQIKTGELGIMSRGIYTISDLLPEEGPFESILFFFDQERLDQALNYKGGAIETSSAFFHTAFSPAVNAFVNALQMTLPTFTAVPNAFMSLKFQELILLLQQHSQVSQYLAGIRARHPQQNLRSLVEQHFDKALRVEDYAYLSGRSISSFRRDFQRIFDTTPQKWLIEQRLAKAHKLLLQAHLSVREVSEVVGYEQVSHFIKAFKSRYSRTPGDVLTQKHHA